MKKHYFPLAIAVSMLCMSCENDDTNFDNIINNPFTPIEIAFSDEPLYEPDEQIPADDNDYVENNFFTKHIVVSYTEEGAQVTGAAGIAMVKKEGGHVTINALKKQISIALTGECSNGSLKVYSDYKYQLLLDGVKLTNPVGAAINNQCGKSVYVVLSENKENRLQCSGSDVVYTEGEDMKGAFFSEGQVIISGRGALNISSAYRNALASDDYIIIRPHNRLTLSSSQGNAIKANDGVSILGSTLNISVNAPGSKGINSEADIVIAGGRTTILSEAPYLIENNDTTGSAGVKCDSTLYIKGGELLISNKGEGGKGINAKEEIVMNNGQVSIVTFGKATVQSPTAIKTDGKFVFNGGSIYAYSKCGTAIKTADGNSFIIAPSPTYDERKGDWFVNIKY